MFSSLYSGPKNLLQKSMYYLRQSQNLSFPSFFFLVVIIKSLKYLPLIYFMDTRNYNILRSHGISSRNGLKRSPVKLFTPCWIRRASPPVKDDSTLHIKHLRPVICTVAAVLSAAQRISPLWVWGQGPHLACRCAPAWPPEAWWAWYAPFSGHHLALLQQLTVSPVFQSNSTTWEDDFSCTKHRIWLLFTTKQLIPVATILLVLYKRICF